MKKLLFVLLAFLAVFTYISAFSNVDGEENPQTSQQISIEIDR